MAIVVATVTVDFTANYAGDHRICWRIQGSGDPYDCTTIVNCVGGATVCQAIFSPSVNTTSCDGPVIFEGYVQAECEAVGSREGLLPFTVEFTPGVICKRHEITCENVTLDNITVTSGGGGYNPAVPPLVSIPAPIAGVQATGLVSLISNGSVDTTSVVLAGSIGYAINSVFVGHPTLSSGVGVGFTMDFTTDGIGQIISIEGTNSIADGGFGGSGYIATDLVYPDPAGPAGAPGVQQNMTVDTISTGVVQTITLTDPGSGYTSIPPVTIDAGGPTATAVASLSPCAIVANAGPDCDGADAVRIEDLPLNETFAVCIVGAVLNLTSEYSTIESGCCIPADTVNDICFDYHIENTTASIQNVTVTECDGNALLLSLAPSASTPICAILGGILDPGDGTIIVTGGTNPCV